MLLPETRQTPCCGYRWELGPDEAVNKGPIFWNPYNNAVQCHNCGCHFPLPEYLNEDRHHAA